MTPMITDTSMLTEGSHVTNSQRLKISGPRGTSRNRARVKSASGSKNTLTVLSMFSGIGGLDLGIVGGFKYKGKHYRKNGFEILSAYESDERAVETFRLNHPYNIFQRELSENCPPELTPSDVLIGGFPCQDFSSCGPKKGLNSTRGKLFRVMVEYMKVHQPMLVCGENVPNLARMSQGKVLDTIVTEMQSVGYKVEVWDLYAPEYGVPQNRRRLFFICVRNDIPGFPQKPKPTHHNRYPSIKWAIEDLEKIEDESVPNQSQYFRASKAKKGNGQGDEVSICDKPGYTVRANAKSRVQFHYCLPRRLTVRECARLQTFPDSFKLPFSATTSIMQIGNAVPPVLAHHVGKSLKRFLS